jgi:hypothetical protein
MEVNYNSLNSANRAVRKTIFQPNFPLIYSPVFGPYEGINSRVESIQKDFENLLLTNPGEWPMNPDLGIGIKRYLFENYGSPELGKVEQRIRTQLARYLPFPYISFNSAKFVFSSEDQDKGFASLEIRYTIYAELARLMSIVDGLIKVQDLRAVSTGPSINLQDAEKLRRLTLASNLRNV